MLDDTVSGSAITVDTVSGSAISIDDIGGNLTDIISELKNARLDMAERFKIFEEKFLYIEEQYIRREEFFELIEEKIENFFDIFDSFGNVTLEYQSIIMGILIFLLLWFVIRHVYKFLRLFF